MMKSILKATLVHALCFQLLYMGMFQDYVAFVQRGPASLSHQSSLEELNTKLEEFKVVIVGKELQPECADESESSEEDLMGLAGLLGPSEEIHSREERAFYAYVDTLEGSSCVLPQKESAVEAAVSQNCEVTRVEGFIEEFAAQARKREKDEEGPPALRLDDPKVRKFHQDGLALMQEVREYMADTSVEREKRVELLVNYLGSVALPMRDLIVVLRGYIPREYDGEYFYESLLPEFNEELTQGDALIEDIITNGPNKMVENFHLEIEEGRWGRRKLRYNSNEVLARDIVSILKVPTANNYVRAMKWMTLQMMLTQVFSYEAMLGETKPLEIPLACQNHFNGSLPKEIEMQYSEENGDQFLESILADHGLIAFTNNTSFNAYYSENVNRDPMIEGYSGLMPFEDYRAAHVGLENKNSQFLSPVIDDFGHFDEVHPMILGKGLSEFHDSNSYLFGLMDFEDDNYFGSTLLQKMFTQPADHEYYEYTDDEGEIIEISHIRQNLSTLLVELMQRHRVEYWDELITPSLESQLKRQLVKIDFPSLHGASIWRGWALNRLEEWAQKAKEEGLTAKGSRALITAMRQGPSRLIQGKNADEHLSNLISYLRELKISDDFIPTRRLTTGEHVEAYKTLGNLWYQLRDRAQELPVARTNEYEYLTSQMETGNPWARVRLSYLVLMEELTAISKGEAPNFTRIGAEELSADTIRSCQKRDVSEVKRRLMIAAGKMGITKKLTPAYATSLLEKKEKEQLWQNIVDGGHPLFKQHDNQGKPFYEMMEQTSFQTLLTSDQIQDFVNKHIHTGLREKAWEEIESFFESEEGQRSQFYTELYKLKGNPEAQMEYFEEFASSNGIDLVYDAKMGFLETDNTLKKSILKSLLRGSANLRKNEIMGRLSEFCNLEPNDHENFKKLYFATTKAQNKLNQLTGAPAVPQEVLDGIQDKLSAMSDEEWTDMYLGIGAGLLGVTAMLIGGACTGLTGGLCAPLGIAMAAAGASAMTMQVTLLTREFGRKTRADRDAAYIQSMEKLGFADRGNADNVMRSWFWTAFEAISIIPLVGVTARAVTSGSKLAVVSTGMMARNLGPKGFREAWKLTGQAGRTVVAEADVKFSRLILGFDSFASQAKQALPDPKIIGRAFERAKGLRTLHSTGQLSAFAYAKKLGRLAQALKDALKAPFKEGMEYTSRVVVRETPKAIDEATAKTVAEYFAGNPKGLHHLMSSYAKRVPKATKQMARYEEGTSLLGKVTLLPWIRNGIRSLRSAQLAKYGDDIIRIEKELAELVAKNGDLEEYVLKNVDDLTDIFMKIPVRKREIPYMFFIQGGPHLGKSLSSVGGKTAKAMQLHRFSNGLVMRKFFNARSRLIYESMKSQAREVLGLKTYLASETAFEAFEAFQKSVAQVSDKADDATKAAILSQFDDLQDKLSKEIFDQVSMQLENVGGMHKFKNTLFKGRARIYTDMEKMDLEEMKRLLFRAETEHERAIAATIWSTQPVEKLFELQEVGDVAHRVIRELSQYDNVEEFQGLLNALKVLTIKRDPGVVEIM